MVCTKLGSQVLKQTSQTGRITLRNDGRELTGRSVFQDQTGPVTLDWDPGIDQYRGKIRLAAPGGRVNMDVTLRVVSPRKMVGALIADVRVDQGGIRSRCTISRGLVFDRTGN